MPEISANFHHIEMLEQGIELRLTFKLAQLVIKKWIAAGSGVNGKTSSKVQHLNGAAQLHRPFPEGAANADQAVL